jgi:hypothetical protein
MLVRMIQGRRSGALCAKVWRVETKFSLAPAQKAENGNFLAGRPQINYGASRVLHIHYSETWYVLRNSHAINDVMCLHPHWLFGPAPAHQSMSIGGGVLGGGVNGLSPLRFRSISS